MCGNKAPRVGTWQLVFPWSLELGILEIPIVSASTSPWGAQECCPCGNTPRQPASRRLVPGALAAGLLRHSPDYSDSVSYIPLYSANLANRDEGMGGRGDVIRSAGCPTARIFHTPIATPTPRRVRARGLQQINDRFCRPGPLTRRSGYEISGLVGSAQNTRRHP